LRRGPETGQTPTPLQTIAILTGISALAFDAAPFLA
jgi:hypothetical protein